MNGQRADWTAADLGNRLGLACECGIDIALAHDTPCFAHCAIGTAMASQRIFQLGLRRAAAPSLRVQPAGRMVQRRYVRATLSSSTDSYLGDPLLTRRFRLAATESISSSQSQEALAKQRLQRPVSPHLGIYRPQITWIASSLNRVTGITLSGSLYLFGFAYLAAPTLGWHLETQSMVAAVAAWPVAGESGVEGVLRISLLLPQLQWAEAFGVGCWYGVQEPAGHSDRVGRGCADGGGELVLYFLGISIKRKHVRGQ